MTQAEFNRWWGDYSLRFPDTGEWVRKQPRAAELMGIWQEALSSTALTDALEVNRQLTRGELERWKSSSGYHEREETPAMVRKMAWNLARERGDFQEHESYERVKRDDYKPGSFPIGLLFRDLCAINERWKKDPAVDKAGEHKRVTEAFKSKYCRGTA